MAMPMIRISISYNEETGKLETEMTDGVKEYRKRNKGNSLLMFPDDFIVIDTETTGLDPEYDELIEVCAVKVIAGQEVDRFESLIKPSQEISSFITELTGISNDMLRDAPLPKKVIPELKNFIGNDILVAHNAHFDINFLYDNFDNHLNETFSNDFICTMRLSRRIYPKFKNHKLKTICENLLINLPTHRALEDVISTWEVYKCCRTTVEQTIGFEQFGKIFSQSLKARDIKTQTEVFDINHHLYGKNCVFTGTLSKMLRRDAMQIVVDLGGICADNINRNTNYLVLGIQDYRKLNGHEKSSKLKKAEDLINNGFDIEIISENNFYDLVLDES
jgi:DNA polymerase-3 subunit epsilon